MGIYILQVSWVILDPDTFRKQNIIDFRVIVQE